MQIYDANGGLHAIDYINPLALMQVAAAVDKHFFDMVAACLQRANWESLEFTNSHDGVVPGNNLRPDCDRAFYSFLWSWVGMPAWMTCRGRFRWFTLLYITKREMEEAHTKAHHIFSAMLWKLFGNVDDFDFTTGIFL